MSVLVTIGAFAEPSLVEQHEIAQSIDSGISFSEELKSYSAILDSDTWQLLSTVGSAPFAVLWQDDKAESRAG
jgi:hypothetical protein